MSTSVANDRRPWLAVGLALVLGFAVTCMVSSEPVRAYRALLTAALPDLHWDIETGVSVHRISRLGAVVEEAITLCLLGLAMLFGLRARQFAMGADGQLFLAALAATWTSVQLASLPLLALPGAVVAAVAVGFAWGWIPGYMKARWGSNEIVSSLMLNAIAIQLYRWAITAGFNDPAAGFLASPRVPSSAAFTAWIPGTNVSAFLLIAPLVAGLAWFVLNRCTVGYEIRAVGESPEFARQCGMPVKRTIVLSMALGGAFAGLAGLHLSNALLKQLPMDLTPGIGFEGLVVTLLARNDPRRIPIAAFFYAWLKVGAQAMERASDMPREVILVVQALIVLFVACEHFMPPDWRRRLMRMAPAGLKRRVEPGGIA